MQVVGVEMAISVGRNGRGGGSGRSRGGDGDVRQWDPRRMGKWLLESKCEAVKPAVAGQIG